MVVVVVVVDLCSIEKYALKFALLHVMVIIEIRFSFACTQFA